MEILRSQDKTLKFTGIAIENESVGQRSEIVATMTKHGGWAETCRTSRKTNWTRHTHVTGFSSRAGTIWYLVIALPIHGPSYRSY